MSGDAVVVLSGGQDSTTSLFWAKRNIGGELHALTFDYGQRHVREVQAAQEIAALARAEWTSLMLPVEALPRSALVPHHGLRDNVDESGYLGLPATFTPGRNILFLTYAAMHAYKLGINHIVTGVCQTDFSGYPDCREPFIHALQQTLNLGMAYPLTIHTPLMHLTKAQSIELAISLGDPCFPLAMSRTITCYHGKRPGCGECPACVIRARGFEQAGVPDPGADQPLGVM